MRQTIVEKILSEHSGKRVKAGDAVVANVDLCYGNDCTGQDVTSAFLSLGAEALIDPARVFMVMDHAAPSPSIPAAGAHHRIRSFSSEYGSRVLDVGLGISQQALMEAGHLTCGDLIVGADTHTTTCGALNAMAVGVSATDVSLVMASGKCWFRVPETIKVIFEGVLSKGVYAKDMALALLKETGAVLSEYKAIELEGSSVSDLSMDGRFTLSSMCAETGAKCGILKADKKTFEWIKKHSAKEPKPQDPDPDARYAEVRKIDVSALSPKIARPHSAYDVCDIDGAIGISVDAIMIGSCANGRIEDMEVAARILKGKKVAKGVKLIITPASRKTYLTMVKKGLVELFIDSGATINNPGCGPCAGKHQGVLGDGEVALSTSGVNGVGRMGSPRSDIYIASPATAAATAIAGKISDPREYKRKL